jgi:YrbI family 3-deoxy-D-manno-octulosonate 8-phosphate phosphatase
MTDEQIKIVFCDIDGTITDGMYHVDGSGSVSKSFHTRDIHALHLLSENSEIYVAVVTGSEDECNRKKFEELDIPLYEAVRDKLDFVKSICANIGCSPSECLFIGDGINDMEAMIECGLKACPADASPVVLAIEGMIISEKNGGCGAVEDIILKVLK